jgi:hypothetical protein
MKILRVSKCLSFRDSSRFFAVELYGIVVKPLSLVNRACVAARASAWVGGQHWPQAGGVLSVWGESPEKGGYRHAVWVAKKKVAKKSPLSRQ